MPAEYRVELSNRAERELDALHPPLIGRVMAALDRLAVDPRPRGCKKLREGELAYRYRVGDYRILYQVDDAALVVRVYKIRHRSDAYS